MMRMVSVLGRMAAMAGLAAVDEGVSAHGAFPSGEFSATLGRYDRKRNEYLVAVLGFESGKK
jgi:hypothetical protein